MRRGDEAAREPAAGRTPAENPAPRPGAAPALRLEPWSPTRADEDPDEPLGGEPPCMAQLLDEDGRMPD